MIDLQQLECAIDERCQPDETIPGQSLHAYHRAITDVLRIARELNTPTPSGEACEFCGKPIDDHSRCPDCGYTECDMKVYGDHHLCTASRAEV